LGRVKLRVEEVRGGRSFEEGWARGAPRGLRKVRVTALSSPFLLGFDQIERALDKATKSGSDGYPPYNIERLAASGERPERLRITLAVAGFARDDIEVTQEESQLWIRGRQEDDKSRDYIHRGIAARQFQRSFLLAEGMQVLGAELANGLLEIDVARPPPEKIVKKISIVSRD
jgi:HSP20 family molecular chaperone IbpA